KTAAPRGAGGEHRRRVEERLDVFDQGWPAVEALHGGERGLQPRIAALALERVEQRRLLAADVGAGGTVDDQLQVAAAAEDVLAEVAGLVGFGDRGVEDVGLRVVLAADEDEGVAGAGGGRGGRDPLDQLMRVALHQLAVLEGTRLGLVGVAAEVLRHLAARQEGGLFAHREAGAAATPQAGLFELFEDLLGLQLAVGLFLGRVTAVALVAGEGAQRRVLGVLEQDARLRHLRPLPAAASPAPSRAARSRRQAAARSPSPPPLPPAGRSSARRSRPSGRCRKR